MSFARYFETAPLPQEVFPPQCDGTMHVWEDEGDGQHFICSCGAVKQVVETADKWRHIEILEPVRNRVLMGFVACPRCKQTMYLCVRCRSNVGHAAYVCHACCGGMNGCANERHPDAVREEEVADNPFYHPEG